MSNIVRIDPTVQLPPSQPGEYCVTPFRGAENKFYAGVWSADPHSLDFDSYEVDEVCVVLSGKIMSPSAVVGIMAYQLSKEAKTTSK
jgi:hypothetical protein